MPHRPARPPLEFPPAAARRRLPPSAVQVLHTITPPAAMDPEAKALDYHDVLLRQGDVELLSGPHWLNDQACARRRACEPLTLLGK